MEEVSHVIEVLTRTKQSLEREDTKELRNLSDQTIHAASLDFQLIILLSFHQQQKHLHSLSLLQLKLQPQPCQLILNIAH